ncbi:MAG: protein kinase [Gemmatimonadota bacterium]|nr:MAG: protein kinase [Gemmatimonadota bacterium]
MNDHRDRLESALSGRYAIERELGRGGMATVYLAHDLAQDRKVAIKVLRPDIAEMIGVDRFLHEIKIVANLSHPHIVPVHDSGQIDGLLFFTMPYIEGESLRGRINREGHLSLEESLRIVREVATALSYAHARGVIHRDIKPENILLSGGVAVVADFGIARAVSAAGGKGLTGPDMSLGTLGYMSPEQAAGSPNVDARSDIYSLGCLLYEMLLGQPPGRWLDDTEVTAGRISDAAPHERVRLDGLPPLVEHVLVRSLAQSPEQRYATAEELANAIATPPEGTAAAVATAPTRALRGRWLLGVGAVAVLAAVVLTVVRIGLRSEASLDPDLIAIAPFDVLGGELSSWSHGLVDLLSASLDGAGPLRAVAPSVVIRRWEGRADAVGAASLGADLGAGLVLYGRLVSAGTDSARAAATLYDVASRRAFAQFEVRDRSDRIDRLADSLAVRIIGDLSRDRRLAGWQLRSLGSSSPAALRAFLRGEQHYRAFDMDSAAWYYDRAIELDSSFALAYSRRSWALGWTLFREPDFVASQLRAGELNHGLARRESLLVVADSIRGALSQFAGDSSAWADYRRLLVTLESAALQYPLDPHVWYQLGEARYHEGPYIGVTDQQAYDALSRAVALDSAFVPAYRHLIELALLLEGREIGRRIAEEYIARAGAGVYLDAARVTRALLDPGRADDPDTEQALAALSLEGLFQTWYDLKWWPDPDEAAVRVARSWAERDEATGGRELLAVTLAYRGHLREALLLAEKRLPALYASLVRLGAVPHDSAAAVFAQWLAEGNGVGIYQALTWWMQQRDTASLQRAATRWDSVRAQLPPERQPRTDDAARTTRAYLALARGDTLEALRRLEDIPNWPQCYYCYDVQLTRARVLTQLGRYREAAELLDHMPFERLFAPASEAVVAALERGRVHERLGNGDAAIRAYSYVVDAWRNADPQLQPFVQEARLALQRLAGEGG